ncbi:TolB-like translocation protein [Seonamhaeicola marinus]|uniref:Exo-alpha-sialidase n=1 Tax=Seonamhaeicola marinus TaxID=1912246 RepID=A0A5D0HKR6_9FLAO|nr:PD40 domain-containing protein [Seonamhaeicola marinus]TYA71560.1 hypothetical protein FUA24_18455 [Seonamhaeicola marinus]
MRRLYFVILTLFTFTSFSQESKPFIQEIVKQFPNVRDIAISPNGEEIMFSAQNINGTISTIISIKKNKDTLGKPKIVSFSGQFFDLEPFFSSDGLKVYYASKRPLNANTKEQKDFDIWYVERETLDSEWSEPKNLGAPVNTKYGEFYPSISDNGNLYFTRDNPELKRKDDIYFSSFENGSYSNPILLPDTINSLGYEYNAFIAPDESFLIYGCYNRKDGLGSGDLYISFKKDNIWTKPINLGPKINSNKMDYCPFVDRNNVLYFTSKKDASPIELPDELTINELNNIFNQYSNGSSRLYKIPLNLGEF